MNCRVFSALIVLFCLYRSDETNSVERRFPASRGFLVYRTVSVTQKSCTCSMSFSCACCQSVIILFAKAEKNLCVNFTYQRNGLNVDVSLGSTTIRTRTVTDYKAFKFCMSVPGCFFSSACVNIVELNRFPRSITACLRLDIYSKKRLWQINYDCVSISTELPMLSANITTRSMSDMSMAPMQTATMPMPTKPPTTVPAQTMATMAMTTMTVATTSAPGTSSTTMSPTIEKLVEELSGEMSESLTID